MRRRLFVAGMWLLFGAVALTGTGPAAWAQQAPSVAETTWSGTENLAGFDQLTFEFRRDGTVSMIDAGAPVRGPVRGTWTQQGQQVTLRFADCEYRGRINGVCMSGTAQFLSGNRTGEPWSFQVQQK